MRQLTGTTSTTLIFFGITGLVFRLGRISKKNPQNLLEKAAPRLNALSQA